MLTLTSPERRALRARAHHLDPVVTVGQHGLTAAVLHEVDVALLAHELIKIRVFSDVRAERDALLERICTEMDAAPVQHLGKILVIWRRARESEPPPAKAKEGAKPPRRDRAAHKASTAPSPTAGSGAARRGRGGSGGKAPQERRRAPATGKGPFEETRRPPRGSTGKAPAGVQRGKASAAGAEAKTGSARRPSARTATGTPAAPAARRRRRQA